MVISFVSSSHGNRQAIIDGYTFSKLKQNFKSSNWICTVRTCPARITLIDTNDATNVVLEKNKHNHPVIPKTVNRQIYLETLKKAVRENPSQSLRIAYKKERQKWVKDSSTWFPTFSSVKSILHRVQRKNAGPLPLNLDDIILEKNWKVTTTNHEFLMLHKGIGPQKIMVFGTARQLQLMCAAQRLYINSFSKELPHIFEQFLTFHAPVEGRMFPMCYAFLGNKTAAAYKRLLTFIKREATRADLLLLPEVIMTSFDILNRTESNFPPPTTQVKGCYSCYTKNIRDQVYKLGLKKKYEKNVAIREWIRSCCILPLVPEDEVINAFEQIKEEAPNTKKMKAFHKYMTNTWIGPNPKYGVYKWNHYTTHDLETDDYIENWSSRFEEALGKEQPTMHTFVNAMKDEEDRTKRETRELQRNASVPERRCLEKIQNSKEYNFDETIEHHPEFVDVIKKEEGEEEKDGLELQSNALCASEESHFDIIARIEDLKISLSNNTLTLRQYMDACSEFIYESEL